MSNLSTFDLWPSVQVDPDHCSGDLWHHIDRWPHWKHPSYCSGEFLFILCLNNSVCQYFHMLEFFWDQVRFVGIQLVMRSIIKKWSFETQVKSYIKFNVRMRNIWIQYAYFNKNFNELSKFIWFFTAYLNSTYYVWYCSILNIFFLCEIQFTGWKMCTFEVK